MQMTAIAGMKIVLLALVFAGVAWLVLVSLFRSNRLLFWCAAVAFAVHAIAAGAIWGAGVFLKQPEKEIRIAIGAIEKLPPPPPEKEKPRELMPLDIPLGNAHGDRKAMKMPKGTNILGKRSGPPGQKSAPAKGAGRTLLAPDDGADDGPRLSDDMEKKLGSGGDIHGKDIGNIFAGKDGEYVGTLDGEGDGPVPAGFPDGKIGGKVYFIRLKHGAGAWNAYDDGVQKMLAFLNKYFPCERDSRAITAQEMRTKYMSKGAQPSFLYIYTDDSFSLTNADVTVLREYMSNGGFLFIDSRPSEDCKARVKKEMAKVLPGMQFAAIANNHPINRNCLFSFSKAPTGENLDGTNYGISRNGKLAVFYTMGNFAHIYENVVPELQSYAISNMQMGANVMIYAISKGDPARVGVNTKVGVKAEISTQALEKLFSSGGQPPAGGGGNPQGGGTVKITNPANTGADGQPEEPDEIDLLGR